LLRAHLKERLPEYMVPAAYVILEQIPVTQNGKVDRNRLPPPDEHAFSAREYEAPQGSVEECLGQIWMELLEVPRVGRHDNFFELGGHSLLAVQLVSRIRQLLNREATLIQVFQCPDLAGLAHSVSESREFATTLIGRADRRKLIPLSWQQERNLVPQMFSWPSRNNNVRDIRARLTGLVDVASLRRALDTLLERHEVLRTQYVWTERERGQRIGQRKSFPFREFDIDHLPAEQQQAEVRHIQEADADEQFSL